MKVRVFSTKHRLAAAAASDASSIIRRAIREHGIARIIAATGASQFDFLEDLSKAPDVNWKQVEMFHLDEYLGLSINHPASFRRYLLDRLINKVGIIRHHLLDGEAEPEKVIAEVTAEIRKASIDVAFAGIGENGHLAFNDPPANFQTDEAYIVVDLDEACRRQQLGEGWFNNLEQVPRRALSMSIRQILKAKQIVCVVPDARKADAVGESIQGRITPLVPASILREHPHVVIYLDKDSSALLRPEMRDAIEV